MEVTPALQDPSIELVETASGEVTLLIDGGQAMQAWERELMWEMADLLCGYGSEFLEVGLGLGISALRIASNPRTRRHVVVEKYEKVIELFTDRHPVLPPSLEIVHADICDYAHDLEPESVDGIFFDPYPPKGQRGNKALWAEVIPAMARALRPGGAIIPFASEKPELNEWFRPFFRRVIVERRSFSAYPTTEYMKTTEGTVYIQCFIKTTEPGTG
jgi:spermidine synthase